MNPNLRLRGGGGEGGYGEKNCACAGLTAGAHGATHAQCAADGWQKGKGGSARRMRNAGSRGGLGVTMATRGLAQGCILGGSGVGEASIK